MCYVVIGNWPKKVTKGFGTGGGGGEEKKTKKMESAELLDNFVASSPEMSYFFLKLGLGWGLWGPLEPVLQLR